ncbi:MAG: SpoIIE family protein phosphatase [Ignavibacteriales bacterium]|nr:SpoIIE family protein phosphatase [Ignavibacteriales bacterium]
MKTTKDIQMEVMEVHNLFWESYARRDIELRFSLCSEDVTFIGSGLHERALNKTEYKNINNEGVKQFPDPFQIEFLWTNLSMINEIVACVESEVVWSQMINNEISTELLRNTTLLKYDNSKWLVTHVHGSVPDYRLKEGDYMTNEQTIIRNKELERQVFERTQDLNETLEKLEKKNRQLEIEASLERVRAVAMSMNNSDDLLSICEVSFKELKKLGFNNLRNAIIHIPNDKEKYFMDYDFSELTGGAITKIEYGSHPIVDEYLEKIKSAKDAYFEVVINEDQLEGWKDFRKKSSQMDDPRLNQATSLYYYLFSIGLGDIGISSFKPIIESQLIILKRFRNVFELAYQRYTDIQKAEAQAREAQIEAALERVRSRTMGMQKSEELKEVIQLVYEQFVYLNIHVEHTGFILDYKTRDDMYIWLADKHEVPSQITIPYFDSPHWNSFIEAKAKGKDFFANHLDFEEKNKFYKDLFKLFPVPDKAKEYYFSCPGLAISTVLLDNVSLYIENFSGTPYSNEENAVLLRFGKVFQQTYTRFLDLQKAEAQARESQIEAALERVRAKAMAMNKSDDLTPAVATVFSELDRLNFRTVRCGIGIFNDLSEKVDVWTTSSDDKSGSVNLSGNEVLEGHPLLEGIFKAWKLQKDYSYVLEGKDLLDYYGVTSNSNLPVTAPKVTSETTKQYYHCIMFPSGGLFAFRESEFSVEAKNLMRRFADVFQLTFTRHLDLKKAEAQNKIIKAENERKTKELEDARQLQLSMLPKVLPQLPHLDIAVHMKTATEVGGDYYDYNVDSDGTLTFVVGDATGHGMMSGMMVSIMKSFFISHKSNIELKEFFENANNSIKEMQLGRLMMSFMGVQITSEKVIATNAGMPSLIYFRNKSQKAGEFVSNNLPLGAMKGTMYSLKEINYEKGDTLLLMSDGFAELKNKNEEQYGYERVKEEFKSVAHKNSKAIVKHLNNSASNWILGVEPDDDVTFVVIKVK